MKRNKQGKSQAGILIGLFVGIIVGAIIGFLTDNLQLWLLIGLALGLCWGPVFTINRKKAHDDKPETENNETNDDEKK